MKMGFTFRLKHLVHEKSCDNADATGSCEIVSFQMYNCINMGVLRGRSYLLCEVIPGSYSFFLKKYFGASFKVKQCPR